MGRAFRSLGLLAAAAMIAACATSPTGRSQLILVSDEEMNEMGATAFEQMRQQAILSGDDKARRYVRCVALAITNTLPEGESDAWELELFDDDTANAFALPGRKIGVHTGLLAVATDQDQLATVLGHEVAHVLARHGAERVSQQLGAQAIVGVAGAAVDPSTTSGTLLLGAIGMGMQYGVLMPYSRSHESEADLLGLDLMAQSGFDPRASVTLWQNMAAASGGGPPEWLSTHPAPDTRIADLEARIPAALELRSRARAGGRRPACR